LLKFDLVIDQPSSQTNYTHRFASELLNYTIRVDVELIGWWSPCNNEVSDKLGFNYV